MNILYYLDSFPAIGGIETVTATLANCFVKKGYGVSIVSHRSKGNAGKTVEVDGRVNVFRMPSLGVSEENRRYLKSVIEEQQIDVIIFQDSYAKIEGNIFYGNGLRQNVYTVEHSQPYFGGEWGLPMPSLLRRIVSFLRHPFSLIRYHNQQSKRHRFLYENSDRYVLLSDRFFGEFRAVARLNESSKLRAVPNPLASQLRAGSIEKENEVLYCASLFYGKGCDLLLKAWQELGTDTKGWRLIIVGDGAQCEVFKRMAADYDLANVCFEGYQSDPSIYFARAKIFALPSRREGWALVLVEAMANGCVPVAFESYASVRDIIVDGENGYLVPAFDIERFSHALRRLMFDDGVREEMRKNALNKVPEFDVERVAARWESIFAERSQAGRNCL